MACVYIVEAHAADEWPAGARTSVICQPKTLDERREAAAQFVLDRKILVPVLVDGMDNAFERAYAAWPFRFYVVASAASSGPPGLACLFKAQPHGDAGYDWADLYDFLDEQLQGTPAVP